MISSPKTNAVVYGLIEGTSSMLNEINQNLCIKMKKLINRGKRSKTLSEVKPVESIAKYLQSFLVTSSMQKEVLPSHKL